MTETKFSPTNYFHPTPVFWKKIGDMMLILVAAVQLALPTMPVAEPTAYWIGFSVTMIGVIGKFTTNFFKATPPTVAVPENILTPSQQAQAETNKS